MKQSKAFRTVSIQKTVWLLTSTLRPAAMSSVAVTSRAVVSPDHNRDFSHMLTLTAPHFHPEGQRPSAPCPTCIKEKNDRTPRDLFSIRGFQKDDYDPVIPATWFVSPPNFDDIGKDMEALKVYRFWVLTASLETYNAQFQYMALYRYCQSTHATRKPLQDAVTKAQKQLASQHEIASQERAKNLTLQQENQKLKSAQRKYDSTKAELERLQNVESEVEQYRGLKINPKDLETFRNNKEAIRHYLGLVPHLIE